MISKTKNNDKEEREDRGLLSLASDTLVIAFSMKYFIGLDPMLYLS